MSCKTNEENLRDAARSGNITTIMDLIGRGTNIKASDSVSSIVMRTNWKSNIFLAILYDVNVDMLL